MRDDATCDLGIAFVDFQWNNFGLGGKWTLAQSEGRVAAVCADFQNFANLVLCCHLLQNFAFLWAEVHHPAHLAIPVDELKGFEGLQLGAVL